VPDRAQEGVRRGPFAALLLLLGLVLSSGPFAGGVQSIRDPGPRLGSARFGAPTSALRFTGQRVVSDDAAATDAPTVLPPAPRIVVEPLTARPLPPVAAESPSELSPVATASYRARAPPAA